MGQQLRSSEPCLFHSDLGKGRYFFASSTVDGLAMGMETRGGGQHNGTYNEECDQTAVSPHMDGWGGKSYWVREVRVRVRRNRVLV